MATASSRPTVRRCAHAGRPQAAAGSGSHATLDPGAGSRHSYAAGQLAAGDGAGAAAVSYRSSGGQSPPGHGAAEQREHCGLWQETGTEQGLEWC
ncbi:hypothetical protein BS78_08G041000 [Paspalum vaginatum]|nr:hypothetical protein BS78_08G041000 [Paspalum vaginatum]